MKKVEESNGSIEDIGGAVGPAPVGVAPKVPDEGELCAMAGKITPG